MRLYSVLQQHSHSINDLGHISTYIHLADSSPATRSSSLQAINSGTGQDNMINDAWTDHSQMDGSDVSSVLGLRAHITQGTNRFDVSNVSNVSTDVSILLLMANCAQSVQCVHYST